MIYPEELVNLLKKHGYWKTNLFVFVMMCVSIVIAIVFSNGAALVNAMWCGISIFGDYVSCMDKEEHLVTKEKLADAEDDLCISKHEVERLTLELETYKSAQNNETGKVEKVFSPGKIGGNPKRRPAPKRKPKTNETKNENQN